jgi:hypothetical protein
MMLAGFAGLSFAQSQRLWVLSQPDMVVEYDPGTFAPKQSTKVPSEVLKAPKILQINHKGQMLYAPNSDDPSPDVGKNADKFWFWDGRFFAFPRLRVRIRK